MTQLIGFIIGLSIGYLIGSAGSRYQRPTDLQALIDLDATKRRADGLSRRGDLWTEYEPAESAAGVAREVLR